MVTLVNRAKVATSTTGTGTVSLGAAEDGYQTFSDAGLTGSETVRYTIEDGDAWEIGTGGIDAAVTTMSRTLIESSTGSKLNLSGNAVVYVTAAGQDIQQPPSEGAFENGDKTKLDGIEAGADVTDTTNVTAAGALMDSEVTNLAQVKAFDSSDYATAAQGATADSAVQPNDSPTFGSITVTGTVDGRDVAADGSKLDGIEAGANVTDTANVTAAGALMDSEVTNLAQVKAFDSADYATAAQGSLADSATQPGDNISTLTNDAGFTTNVGDITGVTAGSGITGGGTSGTVTVNHADTSAQTSVNNSGATFVQDVSVDGFGHVTGLGSATITPATIGAATSAQGSLADSATQPGDNISTLTNDAGYTTNVGDITNVSAGTGLSGGGSSGSVTLNVDLSELADMTAAMLGTDEFIVLDAGADRRKAANEIGLSIFNNDAGYTTNVGDITGVTAGSGITGGGTSGTVTINHADTSSQGSVNNSGATVIQDVTLDTYGHITALGSVTLTAASVGALATSGKAADSNLLDGLDSSVFMLKSANSQLDMNNYDIVGVDQIIHEGDGDTYMQFHAADQWRIVTGGAERLEVNNSQITSTEPVHAPSFHGDGSALTNLPASAPSTSQVLSATAGASLAAVGSYALLVRNVSGSAISQGSTYPGSALKYSGLHVDLTTTFGARSAGNTTVVNVGTWRAMGQATGYSDDGPATLFLRIS